MYQLSSLQLLSPSDACAHVCGRPFLASPVDSSHSEPNMEGGIQSLYTKSYQSSYARAIGHPARYTLPPPWRLINSRSSIGHSLSVGSPNRQTSIILVLVSPTTQASPSSPPPIPPPASDTIPSLRQAYDDSRYNKLRRKFRCKFPHLYFRWWSRGKLRDS